MQAKKEKSLAYAEGTPQGLLLREIDAVLDIIW